MKTYVGTVNEDRDWQVHRLEEGKRKQKLPLRLHHVNHSPCGFAWSYGGSGPAQLAFALVYEVTGDADRARKVYQDYKWAVIARLPQDQGWTLTETEILAQVIAIEQQQAALRSATA